MKRMVGTSVCSGSARATPERDPTLRLLGDFPQGRWILRHEKAPAEAGAFIGVERAMD